MIVSESTYPIVNCANPAEVQKENRIINKNDNFLIDAPVRRNNKNKVVLSLI